MWHKIRTYILGCCLLCATGLQAKRLSDNAQLSLLTCTPGEQLYARYGHTALRVVDPDQQLDVIFNYGVFNFNTDGFYWKFVRGETWYELGAKPTKWFMIDYIEENRPVYEQVLNFTPEQKEAVWKALLTNYLPQNRKYLYNFVFDNCATRPYLLLQDALGEPIQSSFDGHTGMTYRAFIRHYTGALSWENAGINLLFGPKADQPMSSEQRLFLPEELMYYMQEAHLADGTPLVSGGQIAPFFIQETPWYASWPLGLAFYFLIVAAISFWDRRRGRWAWGLELAVAIPYILLLIIVTFLTFFSCHPLVGFGWRLLIIPLTHLCARLIYIIR